MYLTQKNVGEYKYWYLEETERTEEGPRKTFSIYLGKPDRIYDLVKKPLRRMVLSTHTFGTTAAILHAVEELELKEILSEEMSLEGRIDMDPAQRLITILAARYERPASKLDTVTSWYKRSMLPLLWKCKPPHENTVYETMDSLTPDVRTRIKNRLKNQLLEKGLDPEFLVWDTTNFYTYGGTNGLCRKGRSKDGKHGRPLVGMGILTSHENVPLAQVVFPGNRHDSTVFEDSLPALLNLAEEVADDPKDITLVFDRGCNDKDLIEEIEKTSHCVGKLKRNQDPAELLQTPVNELDHLYTTEKGWEVRGLKTRGEVFGKPRTVVVLWHEGTAKKKRGRLERLKEECLEVCRDLEERVGSGGRGRDFTAGGVRRELEPFDEVSDAFDQSFDEGSQSFTWRFDEDGWERLFGRAGKSLLFTTREDWSAERIIKAYNGKWRVEHSFRLLKGPIPLRPVYHSGENRIREHCFLIFLLLVLHRYLMERIRDPVLEEFEIGEETVHQLLKEIDLVTGKLSDDDKPDFTLAKVGAIEETIINELELEKFIPKVE